jgi:hypothetical protein
MFVLPVVLVEIQSRYHAVVLKKQVVVLVL